MTEESATKQGGSVRNAVAQREQEPRPIQLARAYQSDLSQVLPDHIEVGPFIGSAVGALRKNPALMDAANNAPGLFMNALMECATLGHVPGSKEFYLTTRRSRDHENKPVIVGLEGYRGVVERMYRSGAVASVVVREVCDGDKFEFVEGIHSVPVHEVDWFSGVDRTEPANILAVYAYARLVTGVPSRVVILPKVEIEKAKARSDAGKRDAGPWVTDYRAMAWKTAAHRLEPWVPTSAEFRREQLRATAEADRVRGRVNTETGELLDDIVDADVVDSGGSDGE